MSRSRFSAGLAPYRIKEPLSRSWGQKPKLDSTSRGDTTCKAQFEVMGQHHCKSEPLNSKQSRDECCEYLLITNRVFCPRILPACSSVQAAIHRVAESPPSATEKRSSCFQLFIQSARVSTNLTRSPLFHSVSVSSSLSLTLFWTSPSQHSSVLSLQHKAHGTTENS